jgi:hypothetical protein
MSRACRVACRVLDPRTMLRSVLAVAVVAATGSAASAGVYLGLGIGTAADMSANTTNAPEAQTVQGNGRSGKLMVGYRFPYGISVEATGTRYGMFMDGYPADGTQLALAGKYSYSLGQGFELFGRLGLQHTSIGVTTQNPTNPYDGDGTGWLMGLGAEYRFKAILAGCSVFVDYEHVWTSIKNNSMETFDENSGVFMAGVTLSL